MLNITADMLNKIAPGANQSVVNGLVPFLNQYLPQYSIDTPTRMKHFFGQAAEETASFRTLTEYASGAEYQGRSDLGNIAPGSGVKYKGRGIFQITGMYNYEAIGKKLGIDLVNSPLLAATPQVAVETACIYWNSHNLSSIADSSSSPYDSCVAITRKINGGTNGLAVRWQMTQRAELALTGVTNNNVLPVVLKPVAVLPPDTPAVFPTPVTKDTHVATADSVQADALNNLHNSNPIVYTVDTVETFIKRFF